jgi:hypothetical protein
MLKRYLLGFVCIKKILKFFTFKNIIRAFSYMILFKLVYFIVYRYLDTEFLGTFLSSIIAGSILIIFKFIFLGLVESLITPLYCDGEDYDNNDESSKSKENNDRERELNTMIDNYKKELKESEEINHKPRQKAYDCMLRIKEKDPHYFLDKSNFDSLNYIKILYLVEESKGSPLTPTDMHIAQSMLFGMVVTKEEYEQVGKPIIPNLNIIFPLEIEEVEKICYRKE